MPFDTIERSIKRPKSNFYTQADSDDNRDDSVTANNHKYEFINQNYFSFVDYTFPPTPDVVPIDIPYYSSGNISPQSWQDDMISTTDSLHRPSTCSTLINSPPKLYIDDHAINTNSVVKDILSKVKLSQNDVGITLEAKITNASELGSLIEAFSQLVGPSTTHSCESSPEQNQQLVYSSRKNTKPVNFFESTCLLGQLSDPHSSLDSSERQIADACIDTFFTCWIRYKPIMNKDEFMTWYRAQENPLNTLIVNAICTYVFRHMVLHHPQPGLTHFIKDQDKLKEQEEYFFNQARKCLAEGFDAETDRYTVLGLLFMSVRAEHSKRHHYVGMATSALYQLGIYPRMVDQEPEDYNQEMDTRVWWSAWAIDFALHTAGAPKNTPQPKRTGLDVDFPQVFEQDIDKDEINVITYTHCLKLWKIQSDIITTLYDQDHSIAQLEEYDRQLLDFHQKLPNYLVFNSGFEYAQEDLFIACLRVNIEYNATRIILHKLFIPERQDTNPTRVSLESLNTCLSSALVQLTALKTCTMSKLGKCAFDRDELWRAAEVISIATDIYYNVSAQDQAIILKNIPLQDFTSALVQSIHVLQESREYKLGIQNWFQVEDWIQVEIRRHQLVHPKLVTTTVNKKDYFPVRLKRKKSVSFQNQFSIQQTTTPTFVQFNAYDPQSTGKSPARFRYFNPRKMNKFLFIDEHPMV